MSARAIAVRLAMLVGAVPAAAQQRGTMEFGAFASNTSFDNALGMYNSWGAGGRIGMFVWHRLSLEFEGGGARASRAAGLSRVNVGVLSARVTAVPLTFGRVSVLLGGGVDHTDTYFVESYGVHGLLGAKVALSRAVALRVDGILSYMANHHYTNSVLHLGLSVYRHPSHRTVTVIRTVAAAPEAQHPDSVSAAETRRLRIVEASYQALRDSLARPSERTPAPASSAEALATMHEMIYFPNDRAELSDSAKAILDSKVTVFRANPAMRIVIVGFASEPGSAAYNMALGLRRAEAAKAYLVSQGVEPIRIEIATRGAGHLVVEGPGEAADAANRRGQFRLLIADPYLVAPKP
ncbi:MAG: OmpA family protein [Gemmatimonadales bacterium]|jgi:peptidoglycan-associated lipoprotein